MDTKPMTHPGTIVFINGSTNQVVNRMKAKDVPDEMKFGDTDHGRVPIVKVVAHSNKSGRRILEYGPNDEFVRSTTQGK